MPLSGADIIYMMAVLSCTRVVRVLCVCVCGCLLLCDYLCGRWGGGRVCSVTANYPYCI